MLCEHVERARADRRRVLRTDIVGVERRLALHHLEAVGGNEDARLGSSMRWLERPMRCAAVRRPWRADMDDEIDIAPVDAEIEGGGGNDGAQAVLTHRRLHLAALPDIQRAVMQRDRQIVVVDGPEFLEQ